MYLQLAEGKKRRRGRVQVSGYTSNVSAHTRRYPLNENGEVSNPYIFIPNFEQGGGIYVREDKFDGLPPNQWAMFMKNLAPFQPEVEQGALSEPMFLASRSERKESRERRREAKTAKKEAKTKSKEDRNDRRNQRTEQRGSRAERRAENKEAREKRKAEGGGFDWDKAKDTAGGLIGKFTGRGGGDEGGGDGGGGDSGTGMSPTMKYVLIGGAVVLLAGGIYASTRKTA
jgi:hypothetical protein